MISADEWWYIAYINIYNNFNQQMLLNTIIYYFTPNLSNKYLKLHYFVQH